MRGRSWRVAVDEGFSVRVRSVFALVGACALAVGAAACGAPAKGGGQEITGSRLTIYSSLPRQGATGLQSQAIVNGAKLAVQQAGGRVGKHTIDYIALDDSGPATATGDNAVTSANARKAVNRKSTIAYLGESTSAATTISLPILNQVGIAQVSPLATYVGLTTNKAGSQPNEPDKYYPTNKRTFARIVPTDTLQGAALVTAAKQDRCRAIHIWSPPSIDGAGLARNLATAAKQQGLTVEGTDTVNPKAGEYRQPAAAIKADCFAFTGGVQDNGARVVTDVAMTHPTVKLYGGAGLTQAAFAAPESGLPAAAAGRFEGTSAAPDPAKLNLAGKQFLAAYKRAYNDPAPQADAILGFEAMSLILDAIKRADASSRGKVTRESVYKALLKTSNRQSVLGAYSIDANGDTSLTDYGLRKIVGGKLIVVKGFRAKPA